MIGQSPIEFINALFNIAHLILLIFIIQLMFKERRRADIIEKKYNDLTKRLNDYIEKNTHNIL